MTFLQSLILGIIQGLTEFLPVSSSAHLVILPYLFGWKVPEAQVFPFSVLVQVGTLVSVIIYFWKDISLIIKAFLRGLVLHKPFEDPDARLGWFLILGSLPVGIAGFLLKPVIENAFSAPILSAWFLLGTAALLVIAEFFSHQTRKFEDLKWKDVIWIGFFQVLALLPGISRSGATITGGMTRDLERPAATRFAFLLSIPAMLGAGMYSLVDLVQVPDLAGFLPVLAVGFIAAMLVGYLSIHWLLSLVQKRSLIYFAVYCTLLAVIVLLIGTTRSVANIPPGAEVPAQAGTTESVVITDSVTTAAPSATESTSTEGIIPVQYTGSLEWLLPVFSSCANVQSGFSIVTKLIPGNVTIPTEGSLLLRWGEPPLLTAYSARIGENELALIAHPQNLLKSLTLEVARKVFSGQYASWKQVYQDCPECFSAEPGVDFLQKPLNLYFHSTGEESQELLIDSVMSGGPVALSAGILTPTVVQMRQAVAESTSSVGFLPSGAVDASVKVVALAGAQIENLTWPILVIAEDQPTGPALQWLSCVMQVLNP